MAEKYTVKKCGPATGRGGWLITKPGGDTYHYPDRKSPFYYDRKSAVADRDHLNRCLEEEPTVATSGVKPAQHVEGYPVVPATTALKAEPVPIQCCCGWTIVPAEAYTHFQHCSAIAELVLQ